MVKSWLNQRINVIMKRISNLVYSYSPFNNTIVIAVCMVMQLLDIKLVLFRFKVQSTIRHQMKAEAAAKSLKRSARRLITVKVRFWC